MDKSIHESYENWDMTMPSFSPRSRLFRLKPIGIGTPYVESLASYISRLSVLHCVKPLHLITNEIMPLLWQSSTIVAKAEDVSLFLIQNTSNGSNLVTELLVDKLQCLTLSDDLRFLTMLTWREIVSSRGLLRSQKSWCIVCYEEWLQTNQTVYDPLLWVLKGVDLCPQHRQPLTTFCPHCQASQPFLQGFASLGYCSHCNRWLGKSVLSLEKEKNLNEEDINKQYWIANCVGELLAAAPTLLIKPPKTQFADMMNICLERCVRGNISALARLLKLNIDTVWGYMREGLVPYFDVFLHLCYALKITPLEFLTTETVPSQWLKKPSANLPLRVSKSKQLSVTENDVQSMRKALEAILSEELDRPPKLFRIAYSLGYSESTIRQYCPDLYQALVLRIKRSWTENTLRQRALLVLDRGLSCDPPLPLAAYARELNCGSTTLRKHFPDHCRTIVTRYRNRVDCSLIHQRLLEVLSGNNELLSVNHIAQEMCVKAYVLWDNFPDLCKQITACYNAERKRRSEELIKAYSIKIRPIMISLHHQGIYPSARQVGELLGKPYLMKREELRKVRNTVLLELGYFT